MEAMAGDGGLRQDNEQVDAEALRAGVKIQDRELEAGVSTASGSSGATTKTSFDWPVEYRAAMQAEAAVVTADLHRFNEEEGRRRGRLPHGLQP